VSQSPEARALLALGYHQDMEIAEHPTETLIDLTPLAAEKVKELRAQMVEDGHAARAIRQHYDNLEHLGINEEGLIDLVLTMNAVRRAEL